LDAGQVYDQVDKVLDDEDGIIILIGRHQATSYFHGSGCRAVSSSCWLFKSNVPFAHSHKHVSLATGGTLMTNTKLGAIMGVISIVTALTVGIGGLLQLARKAPASDAG
jgi:hypothetical protein